MKPDDVPPEERFEQLDRTIEVLKDALWQYRYMRQEHQSEHRKTGLSSSNDACATRLKPILGQIAAAARDVQVTAEKLQSGLS